MEERPSRLKMLISRFVAPDSLQAGALTFKSVLIICLSIFFVAVSVRLLQWQNNWLTIDNIMSSLTLRYKDEARFLVNGDIASFVRGSTPEPDPGILMHPPGYSILMALIYKLFGSSDTALRLFQILADAGAALFVFLITIELLPKAVAIIAGLLVALSPQLAYNSLLLLPDSLSALPVLLAIYLITRASKHPRLVTIIAAGALIGVSCWLRANTLLLAPFLCLLVPVLFERGKRLSYAIALASSMLLIIAPITIRNAIVFRSFIPVSLSAGQNLVAGIADYDPEKRFGMEAYDDAACRQEALLYNRPDYAADLYRPDGIERERARIARALSVIRSNKLWFLGVILRRAASMLRYEQVPIVSVEPSITNSPEITNETALAWSSSPSELVALNTSASGKPQFSLTEDTHALRIMGDDSEQGKQFVSTPINVQRKSDYVLRLPVRIEQGRMVIKIESADKGATLASATLPDSLEPGAPTTDSMTFVQLPFVNASADQIRIVFLNAESKRARPLMEVGSLELFRLGEASYLWTRYPRMLLKGAQKFFKTIWMLPLTLIGIVLLALARRWRVLAIALAVPVYFLCVHSPLHVEPRYVLAMHYFNFIVIATALYWIGKSLWQAIRQMKRFVQPQKS